MSSSTEKMRDWTGPAWLGYGFRPFFLGAGLWAALAMVLWMAMLAGLPGPPTRFDPVTWHAHEFLYGYLGAVSAGFLLTAVPNWTGRLPIVGWPLSGLFALWVLGRLAVATSAALPSLGVAIVDLAMPVSLVAVIAREIVAGRNWRNLPVLAMLGALIIGNAVFHWEAARGDPAALGYGFRLGLATAMMMIALIGGRIVPSFTRNWLVRQGAAALPSPPMQRFDRASLVVLVAALAAWVAWPELGITGAALCVGGGLHLARLARWAGHRTGPEPLVWVLHAAYAFLPLGALALGTAVLFPAVVPIASAQHLWMAGAIGLMTLAVMTRATLGHTGQVLTAGLGTTLLYVALLLAALGRAAAGVWPAQAGALHNLAGLAWIFAFTGFAVLFGPLLMQPRPRN